MRNLIFLILLSLFSCQASEKTVQKNQYFDLPGFTQSIIENMETRMTAVNKKFLLNEQTEIKEITNTDSTFWANELKALLITDLNAPKYIGSLSLSEGLKDSESNLLIDRLTPSSENSDLVNIELYYLDKPSQIRKIHIKTGSKNFISKSGLEVTAWFNEYGEQLLIDSIVTVGNDKILFEEERVYESHVERIRR